MLNKQFFALLISLFYPISSFAMVNSHQIGHGIDERLDGYNYNEPVMDYLPPFQMTHSCEQQYTMVDGVILNGSELSVYLFDRTIQDFVLEEGQFGVVTTYMFGTHTLYRVQEFDPDGGTYVYDRDNRCLDPSVY